LRQLEELRNDKTIKANLEARVVITASGDDYKRLAHYADKLAAFFVVSQVNVKQAGGPPKPSIGLSGEGGPFKPSSGLSGAAAGVPDPAPAAGSAALPDPAPAAGSAALPDAPIAFEVGKAEGVKCERCWNFSTHVGEDATYPTVCERCSANLTVIAGEQATTA
jgi:isoleucyl-tRNA synthetase